MSFPRFSLSSFVTLFSFQGTIFILILNSNKFACSSLFLRRRRVHRYARLRKNAKCAWNCLNWWRWGESNSWPPACKAGALPAELHPQILVILHLRFNITSLVIFRMSRMSNLRLASYSPMCLLVTATSLPIAPLRFTISHRHAHTMFRIATQC